jgi:protoheme IX farnesyltransferase
MAIEASALPFELENTARRGHLPATRVIRGYWALTKPDVNALVAITAGIAFCLASTKDVLHFPALPLLNVLLGTFVIAGGSGALNQYIERRFDARMRRTSRRPLAAGILQPIAVLYFGLLLSVAGALYLALAANLLAALLAVLASAAYLFVYTPLERFLGQRLR